MIELTEKEKKAFKDVKESFVDKPLVAIEEGLIQSYYDADEYKELKEAVYGLAKRLLIEVAKKRGIEVNINDSFEVNEILKNERLKDFRTEYYEDYEVLQSYIENKTREMNVTEIEGFQRKFAQSGGINDSIRTFMTEYIPKINSNLYKLSSEIEQEKKDEKYAVFDEDTEDEKYAVFDEDTDDEKYAVFDEDTDDEKKENDVEVISADDVSNWVSNDDEWPEVIQNQQEKVKEEKLSDEELLECIKFLNSYSKLMTYKSNGQKVVEELAKLAKSKKLKDFYDNKKFMKEFEKIMTHDKEKHNFLFHGTQSLENAESIISQGLGTMSEDLSRTTESEFSMDEVLLYSRGFGGEIGRDAIVIIDQPINEDGKGENIVKKLDENAEINFSPSGLQGINGKPNYIVDSKYIIGYVNKRDKGVTFNPQYYDYDKFMQEEKEGTSITESDINKVTINIDIESRGKAKKHIQNDLQKRKNITKNGEYTREN